MVWGAFYQLDFDTPYLQPTMLLLIFPDAADFVILGDATFDKTAPTWSPYKGDNLFRHFTAVGWKIFDDCSCSLASKVVREDGDVMLRVVVS